MGPLRAHSGEGRQSGHRYAQLVDTWEYVGDLRKNKLKGCNWSAVPIRNPGQQTLRVAATVLGVANVSSSPETSHLDGQSVCHRLTPWCPIG